jgi:regulator of nucleoside diphosphate kinase
MLLTKRIMSKCDHEQVASAADRARDSWATYAPHLDAFRAELRRARAVPAAEVPADVVTMNSRFALWSRRSDETMCYTLAYPDDECLRLGRVSVLSPMGQAVLGARAGEEVCWVSSAGPEVAVVRRILYQPEAAGHHRG